MTLIWYPFGLPDAVLLWLPKEQTRDLTSLSSSGHSATSISNKFTVNFHECASGTSPGERDMRARRGRAAADFAAWINASKPTV